MTRLRNLTLCVAALLFVCAPHAVRARGMRDGRAGQTVKVRVGREANVAAHRLKIRFVAVREDSRCPEGVQCIWAGNARVQLKLSGAGNRAATVELNTTTEPREIAYANYTIKLTSLAPRPAQDRKPNARDYVATFVVSKKN
ncbi:MAG TPA: hypothetical protein VGX24_01420 [Pyrinomonadaceae bacterium]|jgi:hypothetical protein|nr:hypothetical protein [Pyrinomonadaceae bacterium]